MVSLMMNVPVKPTGQCLCLYLVHLVFVDIEVEAHVSPAVFTGSAALKRKD